MSAIPDARPASTVVLLRDTHKGLETLLLKRNKALLFAGGFWVFPGGAVDPQDLARAAGDEREASRIAAAREALEEAGVRPRLEAMVQLSHWTTPVVESRRFSTWFYAAPLAAEEQVVIDGSEIHDAQWLAVREAMAEHEAGELAMLPPTYITLGRLAVYDTVEQAVATERERPVPEVLPVFSEDAGRMMVMFPGDAGYACADPSRAGARHRAVLEGRRWRYIYQRVDPDYPPLLANPA
ncbi:MAG: NUDIX domain-containing protein [Halioglobus sp.]|nr:NUDIX domain-containing protein [Halioglobus sp.]